VQRPPPPPCGRQCGTGEGRQAAGPLPAGSTAAFCRSASGGKNDRISCRPPAGGGQTKGSGWMREQTRELPERKTG